MTLLFLTVLVVFIYFSVVIMNWNAWEAINSASITNYSHLLAMTNWILMLPLTILLTFFYSCMMNTMNRNFAKELRAYKQ